MQNKFDFLQSHVNFFRIIQIKNAKIKPENFGKFRDFFTVSARKNRFQTAFGGKTCNQFARVTVRTVD